MVIRRRSHAGASVEGSAFDIVITGIWFTVRQTLFSYRWTRVWERVLVWKTERTCAVLSKSAQHRSIDPANIGIPAQVRGVGEASCYLWPSAGEEVAPRKRSREPAYARPSRRTYQSGTSYGGAGRLRRPRPGQVY